MLEGVEAGQHPKVEAAAHSWAVAVDQVVG